MTKSILIIGAGPGIGLSVARKFGEQGWSIVLSARNPERLAALTADLSARGITVHTIPADASDRTALRAAIAEADRITGGLTAIHYNAAALRAQDLFSMTDDEIEQDLAVNVAGGLHAIRAAASQFGARGGTILVTGGGLALTPHAGYASLGLGKAALRNVVQALAQPLAEQNIRIATATVAAHILPDSSEAADVGEIFWTLATDPQAGWEAIYPAS